MMNHGPQNAKCYPMDNNNIFVTFDKEDSMNRIHYFIASDAPRDFHSQLTANVSPKSFTIDTNTMKVFKPLKPFYLYMRNMVPIRTRMVMSQLSKPIVCATQGIEPKFVKPTGGIFFRWEIPITDSNVTGYTIQFLNNETTNPITFEKGIIGTYEDWPTYVSWGAIEPNLVRIPAKSFNRTDWTEVQVPGNVTGIYIVNIEEVNVRILGSVLEGGELFQQDIQHLKWTNIKSSSFSLEQLKISEIESRGVDVIWTGLDTLTCAFVCSVLKQDFISRDASEKLKCEKM